WTWRYLVGMAGIAALIGMLIWQVPGTAFDERLPDMSKYHVVLLATVGIAILVLTVQEALEQRDALSWLLLLWVTGTVVFTALVNWTVNGRSILPLVPAVAMVVVRRWDRTVGVARAAAIRFFYWLLLPGGALGLLVLWSDCQLANSAKRAAE